MLKSEALKIVSEGLPKFAIFRIKILGLNIKISIPTSDIIEFLKGGK